MPKQKFSGVPYHDDFRKENNYFKILFNPKKTIQVRELNQIQSIFNNQIENFADHIFKFGSRIDAGSVKYEHRDYVKLKSGSDVSKFLNKTIKGKTSGLTATVVAVIEADSFDPDTLYVIYTGAGDNGNIGKFYNNEVLEIQDGTEYAATTINADATGIGSIFSCSESDYYVYGYFVSCPAQTIVLDRYSTEPTYKVGLIINQSIQDENTDPSLVDNAIGSNNYGAPGADRYKIELVLSKKNINSKNDNQFIQLGRLDSGKLSEVDNRPKYSQISDMFARRTYDESGNYTVRPFYLTVEEHEDPTKLYDVLSEGKAYVYGYEVEKTKSTYIEFNKSRETDTATETTIYAEYGNIFKVISYFTNTIDLIDTINKDVDILASDDSVIGTLKIKSFEHVEDVTHLGNTTGLYNVSVYDINLNVNEKIAYAQKLHLNDGGDYYGDIGLDQSYTIEDPIRVETINPADLTNTNRNTLLFKFNTQYINDVSNISFVGNDGVLNSSIEIKTKTVTTRNRNITITSPTAAISLLRADAIKINSITKNGSIDVTDDYVLYPNAQDNYYGYSYIKLAPDAQEPSVSDTLVINYDYFDHGNTTLGTCFSYNSYSDLDFNESVIYESTFGEKYNLKDCLDFRPIIDNTGAFIGDNDVPKLGTAITADVTFYTSRFDLIVLDVNGKFSHISGDSEKYPNVPDNAMPIYKLDLEPYSDNGIDSVSQKYIENKRYTMRDIGKIDQKIKNLEEYVTLNLLDKELDIMEIKDVNGNNKYKNGFLTDDFTTLNSAQVNNDDFQCSIDRKRGELRPSFLNRHVHLELNENNSKNYQVTGDVVTLPYKNVVSQFQPFATKDISVNPYFVHSTNAQMMLIPDNDMTNETTIAPEIKINVDTGVDAVREIAQAAGILGTFWDRPQVKERVIRVTDNSRTLESPGGDGVNGPSVRISNVRTTVERTTTQTGGIRSIEENIQENSLGSRVADVEILSYVKSRDVTFIVSGLLKNTIHYAFFDDVDVNDDVRPINGAFGDGLASDENGQIVGVFRIPNEDGKRFFVGDNTFRITTSSTNSKDGDEMFAESKFYSGGLAVTKQEAILSVSTPQLSTEEISRSNTRTLTRKNDPVGQSFFVKERSGIFITELDLFFSNVGTDGDVWLEIREMINGYPGPKLIPYGRVVKRPENITSSADSSVATKFTFESPVYLKGSTEYCFIVGSNDLAHRVFISKLGGQDIITDSIVSTQPHMGSLFKGQNNRTWNASQYEDIKFTLYKAEFIINSDLDVAFNKSDFNTTEKMRTNPIETFADDYNIRIHHNNHGLSIGDKFKLNVLGEDWFEIQVKSGKIVHGQTVVGASGGFKIKKMKRNGTDMITGYKKYQIQVEELYGTISDNEEVSGVSLVEQVNQVKLNTLNIALEDTGENLVAIMPTGIDNTFNGLSMLEIAKKAHVVTSVDSLDSFYVKLNEKAETTGFTGGDGCSLMPNIVMESMQLNVDTLDFNGSGYWYFDGVQHAGVGSNLQNDFARTGIAIVDNEFSELPYPIKLNTNLNDITKYQNRRSFILYANYSSDDKNVSPVINKETISMFTYGNRIENNSSLILSDFIDESTYTGGSEKAKYVTQVVNLKNPATSIKLLMDILNNIDSTIEIWYKILGEQSYGSIQYETWSKAEFDVPITENEFVETEINIPNIPGQELNPFKSFQIKIIMKTENSANVPKIKRFRCIALT